VQDERIQALKELPQLSLLFGAEHFHFEQALVGRLGLIMFAPLACSDAMLFNELHGRQKEVM
jgi:hypothetical protein